MSKMFVASALLTVSSKKPYVCHDAWYVSDFGGYILGHEWSGHGIIDNGCIDFIQYADFSIA